MDFLRAPVWLVFISFSIQFKSNRNYSRPSRQQTDDGRSRVICPGGVGFVTSSAERGVQQCWWQN
jgi:hypothetical protein